MSKMLLHLANPARKSRLNSIEPVSGLVITLTVGASEPLGIEKQAAGRRPPLRSYEAGLLLGKNVGIRSLRRNWTSTEPLMRRWLIALRRWTLTSIGQKLLAFGTRCVGLAVKLIERGRK